MARTSKSKRRQKLAHRKKLVKQEVHNSSVDNLESREDIPESEDVEDYEADIGIDGEDDE